MGEREQEIPNHRTARFLPITPCIHRRRSRTYIPATMPEKVALIGSGNWGSAIATKIGVNASACADFDDKARRPPLRPRAPHA